MVCTKGAREEEGKEKVWFQIGLSVAGQISVLKFVSEDPTRLTTQ